MSWIKDKLEAFLLGRVVERIVKWLDGKKTAIGALNMVLWIAIYAIPAFTPDYNWITEAATKIRDALQAGGINLDNDLFNVGVSFTVVGLMDKFRKLYKGYKDDK